MSTHTKQFWAHQCLIALLCFVTHATAQVGINTPTPDPSAVLDLTATQQGFLPPRLTTTQRNAIVNPAIGLVVFNTTTQCLNYYVATGWMEVCGTPENTCMVAWPFKRDVVINNGGNAQALSGYQHMVVFDHSSLVAAGKSRADGADFRFTNNQCTQLPFWIESGLNSPTCTVWVRLDTVPPASSRSFTLFYGNLAATPRSNADSTFEFYDDFSGIANGQPPSASKWNNSGSQVQNGRLRINVAAVVKPLLASHIAEMSVLCTSSGSNHDLRVNFYAASATTNCAVMGTMVQYLLPWEGGDSRIDRYVNCGAVQNLVTGGPKFTNYSLRITNVFNGSSYNFLAQNTTNNVTLASVVASYTTSGNYMNVSAPFEGNRYTEIDNVRIRKYTPVTPGITVGAEQNN